VEEAEDCSCEVFWLCPDRLAHALRLIRLRAATTTIRLTANGLLRVKFFITLLLLAATRIFRGAVTLPIK